MALPRNYRIGPGDAVFIDVYGASQKSYQTTVAPDGYVTLEGFGPVQVSGLTVDQANNRIREKIGKRFSSSNIRLSVGQTHTIMVNVVGEVKTPGTYTLSAFATVFNALYMAGGIGDLGTLRNIKVYRGGTLITTVDVYDFLRRGHLSGNVRLADNDVIVVGPYEMLAQISGKVKRPMFYEMKRGESLEHSSVMRVDLLVMPIHVQYVYAERRVASILSSMLMSLTCATSAWLTKTQSVLTRLFQDTKTWLRSREPCSVRVCMRLVDASIVYVD